MTMPDDSYNHVLANATGLSVALDERDRLTHQHCTRVAGLCLELAEKCALSERELGLLHIVAAFHDVGKIGIPDRVLKKSTPFDEQDWAIMKTHSVKSERIILAAGVEDGGTIGLAVRHHHERYDGGGYPDGLAGEAIPILSRIVAIADTYDAMARFRLHGGGFRHRQILQELHDHQGRQHDHYLIGKFVQIIETSKFRTD
jgi:HD-GYP domain-containing protein (c-di-GMP phosphodiesterase class II)